MTTRTIALLTLGLCVGGCKTATPRNDLTRPAPVEAPSESVRRVIEVIETPAEGIQLAERAEGYRDDNGDFVLHGASERWYADGVKQLEVHYTDGLRDGPRITWFDNGQMWANGTYKHGREDGVWTAWWPNGFRQREWHMRDGAWDGMYTEWHDNGEKKKQVEFVDGLRQGPMTMWDDRGNVIFETEYVDDVQQP